MKKTSREKRSIQEIRLANMHRLLNERFGGVMARMARAIGVSEPQMRVYLKPEASGGRWAGEDFILKVEDRLGLPDGSLSKSHDTDLGGLKQAQAGLHIRIDKISTKARAFIEETVYRCESELLTDADVVTLQAVADRLTTK